MTTTLLRGTRVLDLTNVLAGPFCCHQLAHLGADVIKLEVPGSGDLARQLGAAPELNRDKMGISFLAQNSGKRSITVNLKSDAGRALFRKLVAGADVVVDNFRPGVMDRLGLGYNTLIEQRPELIYCAISGFGQDGPLRHEPAYDQIIQGMSGVMSITGGADTAPYRVGYPIADTIGGLTAAFAISAALTRAKGERGCFLDVSMLEAVISTMGWVVSNYLVGGKSPSPMGNDNVTASPSGTFQAGDGLLNIAANKQEQFEALCEVVGRPDLCVDTRFADRQARLENRRSLAVELEQALASDTAAAWRSALNEAGVPAGMVLSVEQALAHPQVADRGLIARFDDVPGVGRAVDVAGAGFKVDGEPPRTDAPAPQLGQHTDAILGELGFSAQEIDGLRQSGAV